MYTDKKVELALATLTQRKKHTKCLEMRSILSTLGFEVRDGKRGGHKIATHAGIIDFTSTSYNCGHGKNPTIKPAYVANIIDVIDAYSLDITIFLQQDAPRRRP